MSEQQLNMGSHKHNWTETNVREMKTEYSDKHVVSYECVCGAVRHQVEQRQGKLYDYE